MLLNLLVLVYAECTSFKASNLDSCNLPNDFLIGLLDDPPDGDLVETTLPTGEEPIDVGCLYEKVPDNWREAGGWPDDDRSTWEWPVTGGDVGGEDPSLDVSRSSRACKRAISFLIDILILLHCLSQSAKLDRDVDDWLIKFLISTYCREHKRKIKGQLTNWW